MSFESKLRATSFLHPEGLAMAEGNGSFSLFLSWCACQFTESAGFSPAGHPCLLRADLSRHSSQLPIDG